MSRRRQVDQSYFKSAIFGFEDGLVSTTGIVAGLSAGTHNTHLIILGGLINMSVEGMSMGAGEFISERGIHSIRGNQHTDSASFSGIIMTLSFVAAGSIALAPIVFTPYPNSVWVSLAAALVSLFLLGVVKAKAVYVKSYLRSAIETFIIGGAAALIGFVVGVALKIG